jgi:hypothetical protein
MRGARDDPGPVYPGRVDYGDREIGFPRSRLTALGRDDNPKAVHDRAHVETLI